MNSLMRMSSNELSRLKRLVQLRKVGNHSKCIQSITEVLQQSAPISPVFRSSLVALRSDCYLDTEQWRKAINDLDTLLAVKVEGALLSNKALALWYLGDLKTACQNFRNALRLNPSDEVTLRNAGRLQMQRGKTRSALLFLRRAVEVSPKEVVNHVLLADAFAKSGSWVNACSEYLAALKIDSSNERSLQQIGKIERYLKTTEIR